MTTWNLTPPDGTMVEARPRIGPGKNQGLKQHDQWVRFRDKTLEALEPARSLRKLSGAAQEKYWADRLDEARGVHFPTPVDTRVESLLHEVYSEAQATSDGDPSVAYVYGPNGTGKSTAVERALRKLYTQSLPEECRVAGIRPTLADETSENQYCPVMPIRMGDAERKEAVDARILDFLGIVPAVRVRDQALQVEHALTQCGVQILSVDETDKIKSTVVATQEIALRWRSLSSVLARHGGMVVLIANTPARQLLQLDQTLASRLLSLEIPFFPAETKKEQTTFRAFLTDAETQFRPWFPSIDLNLKQIAHHLHGETNGQIRALSRAVCHVAIKAARMRRPATEDMLDDFRPPAVPISSFVSTPPRRGRPKKAV